MDKKKKYWGICSVIVVLLAVLVFTPMIIPNKVYKPAILGIPYSLWTSYIITVALVTLTFIGTKVHPGLKEEEEVKS